MKSPDGKKPRAKSARGAIRRKGYGGRERYLPTDPVYVYAFQCEMFIKIGIAVSWPQRLASIQCHNPFPVVKVVSRKVPFELAAKIEHAAHIALRSQHHQGEWFLCTKGDAQKAIMTAIQDARRGWKPGPPSDEFLRAANAAISLDDENRENLRKYLKKRDHEIDTHTPLISS